MNFPGICKCPQFGHSYHHMVWLKILKLKHDQSVDHKADSRRVSSENLTRMLIKRERTQPWGEPGFEMIAWENPPKAVG